MTHSSDALGRETQSVVAGFRVGGRSALPCLGLARNVAARRDRSERRLAGLASRIFFASVTARQRREPRRRCRRGATGDADAYSATNGGPTQDHGPSATGCLSASASTAFSVPCQLLAFRLAPKGTSLRP